MQNWVIVDEKYLDYLRAVEPRIPNSNYGTDKYKPFFGVLFEKGDLAYITQISHPKPRHSKMRNSLDFVKIFIPDTNPSLPDRFVAVINLNYMFPIHKSLIKYLRYKDIDQHRSFNNAIEKSRYIDLLSKELAQINTLNLEARAKKVYQIKKDFPANVVSSRCFDFQQLELLAIKYIK